jgi:glycosyltransferase EpsD
MKLKNIIADNDYDIIHCHTPVGGALARIAARNYRKRGTKVIYTAHGFHFFEGSPVKNWILYYPLEKWLSRFTDVLITLNSEE